MKKIIVSVLLVAAVAGAFMYLGNQETPDQAAAGGPAAGGGGGRGAGGFGGRGRAPLPVELTRPARTTASERLVVVGNLIGDATVSVVPRVAGRLQDIFVRLGDRVARGARIAKIEDQELLEQVKQAEAASEVARATIRQREADLSLAQTSVQRSRDLFARELLPKQTLDDAEARYQAASAQLDLARAQNTQSEARLDELRITLSNTVIVSPVDGFVARRYTDPGAFASQNAPVVDVVDISRVRLVANVVEKDMRQVQVGDSANVEVDAYPGEMFIGRIARVAPVLDPSTRTAPVEIEIANSDYRLKPGMYARVGIVTQAKSDALTVPANAVVDIGGRRGVFLADENVAVFRPIETGIEEPTQMEVLSGLTENDLIVTVGAASLRDGDAITIAGQGQAEGRGRGRRGGGAGAPPTGADAAPSAGLPAQASDPPREGGTPVSDASAAPGEGRRGGRRGGGTGPAAVPQ
ncbi:MAG: efflux RND transporter periplasmic adaptor subunit [Vicinamibacterales bacterium]